MRNAFRTTLTVFICIVALVCPNNESSHSEIIPAEVHLKILDFLSLKDQLKARLLSRRHASQQMDPNYEVIHDITSILNVSHGLDSSRESDVAMAQTITNIFGREWIRLNELFAIEAPRLLRHVRSVLRGLLTYTGGTGPIVIAARLAEQPVLVQVLWISSQCILRCFNLRSFKATQEVSCWRVIYYFAFEMLHHSNATSDLFPRYNSVHYLSRNVHIAAHKKRFDHLQYLQRECNLLLWHHTVIDKPLQIASLSQCYRVIKALLALVNGKVSVEDRAQQWSLQLLTIQCFRYTLKHVLQKMDVDLMSHVHDHDAAAWIVEVVCDCYALESSGVKKRAFIDSLQMIQAHNGISFLKSRGTPIFAAIVHQLQTTSDWNGMTKYFEALIVVLYNSMHDPVVHGVSSCIVSWIQGGRDDILLQWIVQSMDMLDVNFVQQMVDFFDTYTFHPRQDRLFKASILAAAVEINFFS